jgi:hypothetical protein
VSEAHYICAILNAPVTKSFILNSSDSRSFKINPPIHIPEFDKKNIIHKRLSVLSENAHKKWNDKKEIEKIDKELNELIIKLK